MTYQEWKTANKSTLTHDIQSVLSFEADNPCTAKEYKERLAKEQKKRDEIAGMKDRTARREAIAANMGLFE